MSEIRYKDYLIFVDNPEVFQVVDLKTDTYLDLNLVDTALYCELRNVVQDHLIKIS